MKTLRVISVLTLAVLSMAGCSSLGKSSTIIQISGPPGAAFTADYKTDRLSGSVASSTDGDHPSGILNLSPSPGTITCSVAKKDPGAPLSVIVIENGKRTFTAQSPEGSRGIEIRRAEGVWRQNPLP